MFISASTLTSFPCWSTTTSPSSSPRYTLPSATIGHSRRRNRSPDLVEVPDATRLRDVAALGRVDSVEVPDAFAMLGVLTVGDVHTILINHRCGDQLVPGARPHRLFRIRIEFPQLLAGFSFVAANPPVALTGDRLQHAANHP